MEDVKFVINYDYPNSSEDYIHRIGRTARSTNKGTAYTFFTPGNLRQARELIRVLEEARQAINPKLLQLVNTGRGGGERMRESLQGKCLGGKSCPSRFFLRYLQHFITDFIFSLWNTGGRSRFRGNGSNANNPNLMYQDECNRRMRTVGSKDSRGSSSGTGSSSSISRDSRDGGSSRAGDRSSSSYRSSRDSRSYGSSSSYSQYQSGSSQYKSGSSNGGQDQSAGQFGSVSRSSKPPPPPSGPQPLMAQKFTPAQPMMGLMGHSPFQFAPPPPPTSQRK